jgi:hypothetical protein
MIWLDKVIAGGNLGELERSLRGHIGGMKDFSSSFLF